MDPTLSYLWEVIEVVSPYLLIGVSYCWWRQAQADQRTGERNNALRRDKKILEEEMSGLRAEHARERQLWERECELHQDKIRTLEGKVPPVRTAKQRREEYEERKRREYDDSHPAGQGV